MNELSFDVVGSRPRRLDRLTLNHLIIAGWTGRNRLAVDRHIAELEELGIKGPPRVPVFYRVDVGLLTQRETIQVLGGDSSGEVEAVLLFVNRERFVAVGSDHTDRPLEATSISFAKQACAKPISRTAWAWDDVRVRWDELVLKSELPDGTVYQHGSVGQLLHPDELIGRYEAAHGPILDGTAMFCGTLPAVGGIRPTALLALELNHGPSGDRLVHRYRIDTLPIAERLGEQRA